MPKWEESKMVAEKMIVQEVEIYNYLEFEVIDKYLNSWSCEERVNNKNE
jgi:hypothetical protein